MVLPCHLPPLDFLLVASSGDPLRRRGSCNLFSIGPRFSSSAVGLGFELRRDGFGKEEIEGGRERPTWAASEEFAASGEDLDVLCSPLMVRAGGLLVALPYAAVDQQVLLDGLTDEEFGMIGPNKMMEADMLAEDDEGNVNKTGRKCRFYVIDFTDDVLMVFRDYDNSQDDMQYILPFDADDPYALPDLQGIVEKVREWASAENMGP